MKLSIFGSFYHFLGDACTDQCALIQNILLRSRVYDTMVMHLVVPSTVFFPCNFFPSKERKLE